MINIKAQQFDLEIPRPLKALGLCIDKEITPIKSRLDPRVMGLTKEVIDDFVKDTKKYLRKMKGKRHPDGYLLAYIQACQSYAFDKIGKLLDYADAENIIEMSKILGVDVICNYLYLALQEILDFLDDEFPKSFDRDVFVPLEYRSITMSAFITEVEQVRKRLKHFRCDQELVNVILRPVESIIRSEDTNTPYSELKYQRILLSKLSALELCGIAEDDFKKIHRLLLILDFNSLAYFIYYRDFMKEYLRQMSSVIKIQDVLQDEITTVIALCNSRQNLLNGPSLRDILLQWIHRQQELIQNDQNSRYIVIVNTTIASNREIVPPRNGNPMIERIKMWTSYILTALGLAKASNAFLKFIEPYKDSLLTQLQKWVSQFLGLFR